jgi:hypothetical protein
MLRGLLISFDFCRKVWLIDCVYLPAFQKPVSDYASRHRVLDRAKQSFGFESCCRQARAKLQIYRHHVPLPVERTACIDNLLPALTT